MNRIQVKKRRGKDSSKTIGLIIPTTTRGCNFSKLSGLDDLIFFRIFLPSFLKYASNTHYYNFFLGHDHDDPFYSVEKNREEFRKRFEQACPKIYTLTFVEFGEEIEKGDLSTMWSLLADQAVKSCEYLYQLGDDIEFKSKGWEDLFIALLGKTNNIGAVGPKDEQNPYGILTQSFVHCTHLSIFKRYFPKELKNWYVDDWMSEVYNIRVEKRVVVHNRGGKERYEIEKMKGEKDIIVKRDRELIEKIGKCKVNRFKCDNNFMFLEQDNITICGNNFSSYDFKFDGKLNSRLIKEIKNNLNRPEISLYIEGKLYHRPGNHIVSKLVDSIIVQNIENIKLDRCEDDIYLFQQFYIPDDEERFQETKECLKRNVELGLFKKIYLINERIYTNEELGIESDLITQVIIGKRLTYKIFLDYASRENGFCLLSNSDIFFDQTLDNIRKSILRETKSVQCLRRYEFRGEQNLNKCKNHVNYESSQDTWIIHSSKIDTKHEDFDISLGVPGCDNVICGLFKTSGYTILNNYVDLRTYHNHRSDKRNYDSCQLTGTFCYPFNSCPLFNTIDLMDRCDLFWQYPVITEKTFYEQNKHDPYFLGLPWATVIDKNTGLDIEYIRKHLYQRKTYTCCQHIHFRRLIPLLKKLNVTTLYTPHKQLGEDIIEGIRLLACPLYAKVVEDDPEYFTNLDEYKEKYLYSFKGGWQNGYMSDIRLRIFNMEHPDNCYIENTGEWHFNSIVYSKKQNKEEHYNEDYIHSKRETDYKHLLKKSRYTLCPSGSGPNSIRFWEALGSGSIPIILSDKMTLPENKLWEKAILRIKEKDLKEIPSILKKINSEEELQMSKNCLVIYNFFKDNYKGN